MRGARHAAQGRTRAEFGLLIAAAKGDGDSLGTGASRAADAVNVGFRVVGHIVVDHVRNVVDVQTAGGNVGSDQDRQSIGLEMRKHALSRCLALIPVNGRGLNSLTQQASNDLVGPVFRSRENQRASAGRVCRKAREQQRLLFRFDKVHGLLYFFRGRGVRATCTCTGLRNHWAANWRISSGIVAENISV